MTRFPLLVTALLLSVLTLGTACVDNILCGDDVAPPPERTPIRGHALVFCRGQFKYPLYGSYTRRWLDRPLLYDRSLLADDEPYLHVNYTSFARMVDIARRYVLRRVCCRGQPCSICWLSSVRCRESAGVRIVRVRLRGERVAGVQIGELVVLMP
jgi:hypothetical protein